MTNSFYHKLPNLTQPARVYLTSRLPRPGLALYCFNWAILPAGASDRNTGRERRTEKPEPPPETAMRRHRGHVEKA